MYNGEKEKYVAAVFTFGHGTGTVGPNRTQYLAGFDGTSVATGDLYRIVMPRGGWLQNLSLKARPSSTLDGAGHSVEVLINGASAVPAPLLVVWDSPPAGTPPYALSTSASARVEAGDVVSVRLKTKGSTGTTLDRPTVSFELLAEMDYPNRWDFDPATQAMSYSGGDVEIGTDTANNSLTVHGLVEAKEGFRFPDGTIQLEAATPASGAVHSLDAVDGNPIDAVFVAAGGNVGIGIDPTDRKAQEKLTLAPDSHFATEMPAPAGVTAGEQTGGQLAADDYYFRVAASEGTGWTKASPQYRFDLQSANGIRLSWRPVLGATKYRVYRALSAAGPYKYVETSDTYYDYLGDAAFAAVGVPPEETTAYINKLSASGPSWLLGGNLGVGTAQSHFKLHVGEAGNTWNTQGSLVGFYSDINDKYLEVGSRDNVRFFLHRDRSTNSMVFFTNGMNTVFDSPWGGGYSFKTTVTGGTSAERMTIAQNGNVGIGTTQPSASLDVQGGDNSFRWGGDHSAGNHIRLGDLQICWGCIQTASDEYVYINFPAPFLGAAYEVVVSPLGGGGWRGSAMVASPKTSSSVLVQAIPDQGYSGENKPISYIAIGRWR